MLDQHNQVDIAPNCRQSTTHAARFTVFIRQARRPTAVVVAYRPPRIPTVVSPGRRCARAARDIAAVEAIAGVVDCRSLART